MEPWRGDAFDGGVSVLRVLVKVKEEVVAPRACRNDIFLGSAYPGGPRGVLLYLEQRC